MSLKLRLVGVVGVAVTVTALAGTANAAPSQRPASAPPATSTVPVGDRPYQVAVSQRLGRALVVTGAGISEMDLRTKAVVASFGTGGVDQNSIALVQNDAQAYVTDFQKSTVAVVDTKTRRVVKNITVGTGASYVVGATLPGPDRAYVSFLSTDSSQHSSLVGIDTKSATVVQTVTVPEPIQTLATSPRGHEIWAGSVNTGHVYVVDALAGAVTRQIDVDQVGPISSIAFAPGGKQVWVLGAGGLAVLDPSGTVTRFLPLQTLFTSGSANPGTVALNGSGRYAFVEDSGFPDAPRAGQISMVDTRTYQVVQRVTTGRLPQVFDLDTVRGTVYVPNYADNTVTVFSVPR